MDPQTSVAILLAFMGSALLVLVICAAVLQWTERRFPAFSRFLDERFGPENDPWR